VSYLDWHQMGHWHVLHTQTPTVQHFCEELQHCEPQVVDPEVQL
jgi:hypothetical protein